MANQNKKHNTLDESKFNKIIAKANHEELNENSVQPKAVLKEKINGLKSFIQKSMPKSKKKAFLIFAFLTMSVVAATQVFAGGTTEVTGNESHIRWQMPLTRESSTNTEANTYVKNNKVLTEEEKSEMAFAAWNELFEKEKLSLVYEDYHPTDYPDLVFKVYQDANGNYYRINLSEDGNGFVDSFRTIKQDGMNENEILVQKLSYFYSLPDTTMYHATEYSIYDTNESIAELYDMVGDGNKVAPVFPSENYAGGKVVALVPQEGTGSPIIVKNNNRGIVYEGYRVDANELAERYEDGSLYNFITEKLNEINGGLSQ